MKNMKKKILLMSCLLLSGCIGSNTDPLEPRQIIASPQNKWIHWDENPPVDVSQEEVQTGSICPKRYLD